MSDWLECIGGPLDGQYVDTKECCFAWPHGWYYASQYLVKEKIEAWASGQATIRYCVVYRWDGDAGTYVDSDHQKWLAGDRPRVVATL